MPTKIEWCDETWNPVTGCSPISEACEHCYAKRMANRLRGRGYPVDEPFRPTFHPHRLQEPLHWKKPKWIFVSSMGDIFHSEVRVAWIDEVLKVIIDCPQHTFILLTKRPQNIEEKLYREASGRVLGDGDYLGNVWIGVTAENQARANERIPILQKISAEVRFVSVEPMLGPVDIRPYLPHKQMLSSRVQSIHAAAPKNRRGIDWVIAGGETGPGARPMHPDWARSLRDQCLDAHVPFFFKSWGEWVRRHDFLASLPGMKDRPWFSFDPDTSVCRVGKKASGRLIDGRKWDEVPRRQNGGSQ
jgi:protein gp37